jgi:hypothetical protein
MDRLCVLYLGFRSSIIGQPLEADSLLDDSVVSRAKVGQFIFDSAAPASTSYGHRSPAHQYSLPSIPAGLVGQTPDNSTRLWRKAGFAERGGRVFQSRSTICKLHRPQPYFIVYSVFSLFVNLRINHSQFLF